MHEIKFYHLELENQPSLETSNFNVIHAHENQLVFHIKHWYHYLIIVNFDKRAPSTRHLLNLSIVSTHILLAPFTRPYAIGITLETNCKANVNGLHLG